MQKSQFGKAVKTFAERSEWMSKKTKPYVKPITTPRMGVIKFFPLGGDTPQISVIVGLNGLDPEVRFCQLGVQSTFAITTKELMNLTELKESCNREFSLSTEVQFGGDYRCVVIPKQAEGIELHRRLYPNRCPRDEDEFQSCIDNRFVLPQSTVAVLCKKMDAILTSVQALQEDKPTFQRMYKVIVRQLRLLDNLDGCGHANAADSFAEIYRLFRMSTVPSYMVRLFLEERPRIRTELQLYQVYEVCCSQLKYLRSQLDEDDDDDDDDVNMENMIING